MNLDHLILDMGMMNARQPFFLVGGLVLLYMSLSESIENMSEPSSMRLCFSKLPVSTCGYRSDMDTSHFAGSNHGISHVGLCRV